MRSASEPVTADQAKSLFDRALSSPNQRFGDFFLARLLGLEVTYEDDCCIVTFDACQPLFNPQGSLHGGVLATAMDISMGHLLHHTAAAGATLELKVQYLKPVTAGVVRCVASFLRKGRSVSFLQSLATNAAGEPVAHATATWIVQNKG